MKKAVSTIVIFMLILSNLMLNYADDLEKDTVISSINLEESKSIILELERLNFYNPIEFKQIDGEYFIFNLFDKLYNYGNINLIINEVNTENLIIDSIITKDNNNKIILETNKKYVYDITIIKNDEIIISFYGEIITDDNNINKRKCELLLLNDSTHIDYNKSLMSTVTETEPNNTTQSSNLILDDAIVYGIISSGTDVDCFKIKYTDSVTANFWLGNIPSGSNLDLYVYDENNSLLYSSKNLSNSQELISGKPLTQNKWYYIKVIAASETSISGQPGYQLRVKSQTTYRWPADTLTINSCYHNCPIYVAHTGHNHFGIDITGNKGRPVYAMVGGKVFFAGRKTGDAGGLETYGNYIQIDHSSNPLSTGTSNQYLRTVYAHLTSLSVATGNNVTKGQVIGYIGGTGINDNSYDPHLHFETQYSSNKVNWLRLNPLSYWPSIICPHYYSYTSSQMSNYNLDNIKNAGIFINGDFIEIKYLVNIPADELIKYGILDSDLEQLQMMIKDDIDFSIYFYNMDALINSMK